MRSELTQQIRDARNAEFWNELCGSGLAQTLGATGDEPDALAAFDAAYLDLYPYLTAYVERLQPRGSKVLEIGLGYGTLGQHLLDSGADYYGMDIAEEPVRTMRHRATLVGKPAEHIARASALQIPWPQDSFDSVVSIGCLHHTGDLATSVGELHRVLRPGGNALVMLYNRRSFRRLGMKLKLRHRTEYAEQVQRMYDANSAGEGAPHTDYVSRRQARQLFRDFSSVRIESRNFDNIRLSRRIVIKREQLLDNLGRVVGLDLYIHARKKP